ncbi:MAG: NTP transferase domain-containing protein [Bacteroidales bacterium]|nr:NTP transferase domain-containing protein [Bacteroidales bacterium]
MENIKSCSVVILAAGNSSRMGMPKFALKFNNQITFLEEIIEKYKAFGCKKIVVVLNRKGISVLDKKNIKLSDEIKVVINEHLEWERFYSIKSGIKNLYKEHPVFIHNVDNPFVNLSVLNNLFCEITESNFVVPVHKNKGGHPVLLSKKIIKNIISEEKNDLNFRNFLKGFEKKIVEVDDERILVNINSEKEFRKLNFKN